MKYQTALRSAWRVLLPRTARQKFDAVFLHEIAEGKIRRRADARNAVRFPPQVRHVFDFRKSHHTKRPHVGAAADEDEIGAGRTKLPSCPELHADQRKRQAEVARTSCAIALGMGQFLDPVPLKFEYSTEFEKSLKRSEPPRSDDEKARMRSSTDQCAISHRSESSKVNLA